MLADCPETSRAGTLVRWFPRLAALVGVLGLLTGIRPVGIALSVGLVAVAAVLEKAGWWRRAALHPRALVTAAVCGAVAVAALLAGIELSKAPPRSPPIARR